MATSTAEWIEELKGISVLELSERIKALVDEAPKPVKEGIERDEADKLKQELEEAGASVEVK
jgi:ribosomal protein L7/L12